ncbi:hypothetical protein [Embleya sp. AB8]|uniref:hypothetical protein n=1 Tax=Embleya sp. AB8 TaxID=3156304 RepID=UPI003C744D20
MSNHAPSSPGSDTTTHTGDTLSPEQRAALERIAAAGRRAGTWLCDLGRPGSPVWALASAIEHTLGGLRGLREDIDLLPYLDPYTSPAGPVVTAVPLTPAETVAVITAAGCARIAPHTMRHPDFAAHLHTLADTIDDALGHAIGPRH